MNVLLSAGIFAVLLFAWRGLRRLVLILGVAFLVGYLGTSWWLYQHPDVVSSSSSPTEVTQ